MSQTAACLPAAYTAGSDLWRLLDGHFDAFREVYTDRFQAKYGYWRPIVERSVAAFLKCGDLQEGFACVRCPDCKHEMFVAYSNKARGMRKKGEAQIVDNQVKQACPFGKRV